MTSSPSHVDLVVLAVYLAGGDKRAVDTEDIAIKAHDLAPSRFSWRKYPEQINLELVRVSLSDAKKREKGSLLDGSGPSGWTLTPAGLRWVSSKGEGLLKADRSQRREKGRGGSVEEQRWRRERERVLSTNAWSLWSSGQPNVAPRDAADVFRIDSYAVGRMRSLKITRLKSLLADDAKILSFLSAMADILDAEHGSDA